MKSFKLRVGDVIDCNIIENAYILDINKDKVLLRNVYNYHKWYDTACIKKSNPKLRIEEYYISLLKQVKKIHSDLKYTIEKCTINNEIGLHLNINADICYAQSKTNIRNVYKPEIVMVYGKDKSTIEHGYLLNAEGSMYIDGEIDIAKRRKIISYCNTIVNKYFAKRGVF